MSRRRNKQISALIVGLIALFVAFGQQQGWFDSAQQAATATQPTGTYSVARFVDGDTITVNMNGKKETVRMIGVDTPETHKPNTPVQCYGPAASAYTKNLIGQSKVRLESDSLSDNRDRYNRLLRYVYLPDGRLVQEELVKNGYGFAYTSFPFSKSKQFVAAQATAQTSNKGLWSNCHPTQEPSGRWQTESQNIN